MVNRVPPKRPPHNHQPDLFSVPRGRVGSVLEGRTWPDQTRFPINRQSATVRATVWPDLLASKSPLIVAGFASIGSLLQFADRWLATKGRGQLRLLLGAEPFATSRRSFGSPRAAFTAEARRYWLEERSISLHQSAELVSAIEAIESGRVAARFVHGATRLHAKIYVGDDAATQGSSNFTAHGLATQIECNARFTRGEEPDRLEALRSIGENLWEVGEDWNDELRALLDSLLRVVDWREALARSAAELLEGEWAAPYLDAAVVDVELWPSQRAGIAQALWLVQEVGNVLVADATGSGKTRMGAQLVRAIYDQLWSTGRGRRDLNVLISPPAVLPVWEREAVHCGLPLKTISHGHLSRSSREGSEHQLRALQRAQLLAVDEAHNFLNTSAARTRELRSATPDHVVLFTATPINRRTADLLHLVALLGPDNFEDDTLEVLLRLDRRRGDDLTADEVDHLRRAIQRFTVRRTKRQINDLVDRDPDAYRHPTRGRVCRFPVEATRSYRTGEAAEDARVAVRIRDLADQLLGIAKIPRRVDVPKSLRPFVRDDQWLDQRLSAAKGLARHDVLATMRSSRAAVIEHLIGTVEATRRFGLQRYSKSDASGDTIGNLGRLGQRGAPDLQLRCAVPDWLTSDAAWRSACEREAELYQSMLDAVMQLSDRREAAKCDLLLRRAKDHERVLAFDRYLITLALIEQELSTLVESDVAVVIATGSRLSERGRLMRLFASDSQLRAIGLCSEAMSEGLNLQGSSCLVHLDFPTTIRAAEQRVGRVNRMDSPYERIEVWWPKDGPAFATNAEERLAVRASEAERLLGSNLSLPALAGRLPDGGATAGGALVEDAEPAAWDGIRDALEPVRGLVNGQDALVPESTYEAYRHVSERVIARVALVAAAEPWAFFAVRAAGSGAPRWMIVDRRDSPIVDLGNVVAQLRDRLRDDPPARRLDAAAMAELERLLDIGAKAEQGLLPRRLQRSLDQMAEVTSAWAERHRRRGEWDTADRWEELRLLAESSRCDPLMVPDTGQGGQQAACSEEDMQRWEDDPGSLRRRSAMPCWRC